MHRTHLALSVTRARGVTRGGDDVIMALIHAVGLCVCVCVCVCVRESEKERERESERERKRENETKDGTRFM